MVSRLNDLIDQWRRRLTANQMLPHGRDGKFGNQKLCQTYLLTAFLAPRLVDAIMIGMTVAQRSVPD